MVDELISATIVKKDAEEQNDYVKGIPVAKFDKV